MAMSEFEKAFAKMTPEQRKKTGDEISAMMGLPPEVVKQIKRERKAKKK